VYNWGGRGGIIPTKKKEKILLQNKVILAVVMNPLDYLLLTTMLVLATTLYFYRK
jgi:hypothetical protein